MAENLHAHDTQENARALAYRDKEMALETLRVKRERALVGRPDLKKRQNDNWAAFTMANKL